MKRVELCMMKAEHNKNHQRNRHSKQQDECKVAHEVNAPYIQKSYDQKKNECHSPVFGAGMHGHPILKVVGHRHAISGTHQKRACPVPPAALKSPKVAQRGAAPAIEAPFDGHQRGHFSRS